MSQEYEYFIDEVSRLALVAIISKNENYRGLLSEMTDANSPPNVYARGAVACAEALWKAQEEHLNTKRFVQTVSVDLEQIKEALSKVQIPDYFLDGKPVYEDTKLMAKMLGDWYQVTAGDPVVPNSTITHLDNLQTGDYDYYYAIVHED